MKTLTNKEEEIMVRLWEHGPMQVRELLNLYDEPRPHVNTVATLVRILEEKGFVGHTAINARCFQYYPLVSQNEYKRSTLTGVVNKFFGHSYFNAVSQLVQEEKLSVEELQELIQMAKNNG